MSNECNTKTISEDEILRLIWLGLHKSTIEWGHHGVYKTKNRRKILFDLIIEVKIRMAEISASLVILSAMNPLFLVLPLFKESPLVIF